jgi:hypothetical protein
MHINNTREVIEFGSFNFFPFSFSVAQRLCTFNILNIAMNYAILLFIFFRIHKLYAFKNSSNKQYIDWYQIQFSYNRVLIDQLNSVLDLFLKK